MTAQHPLRPVLLLLLLSIIIIINLILKVRKVTQHRWEDGKRTASQTSNPHSLVLPIPEQCPKGIELAVRGQQGLICAQEKQISLLLWGGVDAREVVRGRGETQSGRVMLS